jgi:hypothetical protein
MLCIGSGPRQLARRKQLFGRLFQQWCGLLLLLVAWKMHFVCRTGLSAS